MAVQITVVGEMLDTRKGSHADTIKHLPPLIVYLEGVAHLSLLLSIGEERDPSGNLMLRSVSWTMLKRIRVLAQE
jgi:hypothetical protein